MQALPAAAAVEPSIQDAQLDVNVPCLILLVQRYCTLRNTTSRILRFAILMEMQELDSQAMM